MRVKLFAAKQVKPEPKARNNKCLAEGSDKTCFKSRIKILLVKNDILESANIFQVHSSARDLMFFAA